MILITGATGALGAAVADQLLRKIPVSEIAVLVRDGAKAARYRDKGVDVRIASYEDKDALLKAFSGIDTLYFVSGNDIVNRLKQQETVVQAAAEAGIKRVVYTSFQRKNETATSPIALIAAAHLNTEKQLKASGLTYTILQHGLYTDMLPIFLGEQILENTTFYQPAGEGRTAFALRSDLAEAGANVLLGTGHDNKIYMLTGSEAVSYHDIAAALSKISGQEIRYVAADPEAFTETLKKAGVPDEAVAVSVGFGTAISQGEFDQVSTDLETLLGRKPVSVSDYLTSVYARTNAQSN